MTTMVAGRPPMMPNTGLALLLLGSAGALRNRAGRGSLARRFSILASAVVLALGLGTLAEYVFDVQLGIDQLALSSSVGPNPGRPSPPTALALSLLAGAILLLDARSEARMRPSEWLAIGAWFIAFTALLGLLFGAGSLYQLGRAPVIGVALPTALGLLLTATGLLLERPHAGVMRVATSRTPGGLQLRRLSLLAVTAPMLLGLTVIRLLPSVGFAELPLIAATLAAGMTAASLTLLALSAVPLNRTYQALESSRGRTLELIEQASDGVFVADLDGRYTEVNGAGCRMLGYSRRELLEKTVFDLLPPEDVERLLRSKEELLEGRAHVAEWRLLCKDGTYLPVEVSAKILRDGRWQGLVRDISERKRAEEALRLAEAKSSGILSISADAIISIDENQRITLFNEGAEKIFGYSKAEALGAPLDLLIPERFRAQHRRHVELFAANREVARRMRERDVAIYGLRKNGEEFPADAAISKLEVGGTRLFTIALRDATEQRRQEDEQRLLAEIGGVLASTLDFDDTVLGVARLATRSLADVCIVDVPGTPGEPPTRKIVCRNPEHARLCDRLAQDFSEPQRIPAGRLHFETERAVLLHDWSEVVARLAQSEAQRSLLKAILPRSVMVAPLVARGKRLGEIIAISADPARDYGRSELRLIEELAWRAALSIDNARLYELSRRAIRARDDVLGVVAHDLRNPLSTILMQAALLRQPGDRPERCSRNPAEAIERAVQRMNRLIQDLLDVTRLEAGYLSVDKARLATEKVVADAVEAQRESAARTAVELDLDLDLAGHLPEVWADRDRLLQVFDNLVGNAVKFSQAGGRIVVGAAGREGEVLFWVADTGPGIAADDLPRVFDRFWQAGRGRGRGAGLGLSIVKAIVEAHAGRVWVESAPGRGSTFYFTIPTAARDNGTSSRGAATGQVG
jgi:PAS domain S-box-containing protein